MIRSFLLVLLAAGAMGSAALAQSQPRPMPAYQDDESYGQPTPSDDNASSHDARAESGYPRDFGNPRTKQSNDRSDAAPSDPFDGYPPPPTADRAEDAAHRADRRRTSELNQRARAHPKPSNGGDDYARQSAQYRAELDEHARAMQNYHDANARYAERIARWRARADACEAGQTDACEGPE